MNFRPGLKFRYRFHDVEDLPKPLVVEVVRQHTDESPYWIEARVIEPASHFGRVDMFRGGEGVDEDE